MWEAHNDPRNYSGDVITLLHVPAGQPHVVETIIQLPALRNITIPRASVRPVLFFRSRSSKSIDRICCEWWLGLQTRRGRRRGAWKRDASSPAFEMPSRGGQEDFRKRAAHPLFVSEPPPVIGIKRGRFHDLFTRRSTPESNKPSRKMIKTVVSGKYRGKISCPTSTLFRLCSPLFFSASSSSSRRWRPPDWSLPPLWPWPQRWPPFQRPSSQLEAVKSWPGITTRWPPRRSLPPYPRPSPRHCRPRIHRSPSPRLRFTRHRSRTPRSTIPLLPYNSSP